MTVDGLVAVPSLGLTYLAGSRGGFRPVTWAHACDLPDPWHWFKVGDLVMTTGGGCRPDLPSRRGGSLSSSTAGSAVWWSPWKPAHPT